MKKPMPVRRDLHFTLEPQALKTWSVHGPQVSHFMNTLSIFFPVGERFFIHALRQYRDRISDPELQKAVTAFIGQEAMHGREHEDYNRALATAGLPVERLEQRVYDLLEFVKRHVPPQGQLAATIALEHFTAIWADLLLRDPRLIEGADTQLAGLWTWHAMEETEHKAVAFDAYRTVMGGGVRDYLLRAGALVTATVIFLSLVFVFHLEMIRADPAARGVRGWWNLCKYLFGSLGGLRRLVGPWLDWFKPSFHPWDHDNHQVLAGIEKFADAYRAPRAA